MIIFFLSYWSSFWILLIFHSSKYWVNGLERNTISHCCQDLTPNIVTKHFSFQQCVFCPLWHPLTSQVLWSCCWTCLCCLTSLSSCNTGDTFSLWERLWYMVTAVHSVKRSLEQMKNSTRDNDPPRGLFRGYWRWQQVEEGPELLRGRATHWVERDTGPANVLLLQQTQTSNCQQRGNPLPRLPQATASMPGLINCQPSLAKHSQSNKSFPFYEPKDLLWTGTNSEEPVSVQHGTRKYHFGEKEKLEKT